MTRERTASGSPAWTARLARNFRWLHALQAGVWLVFLAFPVLLILDSPAPWGIRALALASLAVFCAVYLLAFGLIESWTRRSGWLVAAWLAGLVVPALGLIPALGIYVFVVNGYVVALLAFGLPRRWGFALGGLCCVLSAVTVALVDPGALWPLSSTLVLVPVIVFIIGALSFREEAEYELQQRLAVATEREHVARDVHDLLGHSLTVINLKAELALKRLDADPAATRSELEQISQLSRVALAEVRSTVTRLRAPDFGGEIAAARAALTTAGLEAVLPPAAEAPRLAGGNAALFSWVLREAVTNVVRHSGATRCEVRLSAEKLQVDDDGVGPGGDFGNGLNGLAERVREAGGRLVVGPLPPAGAAVGHEDPPLLADAASDPDDAALSPGDTTAHGGAVAARPDDAASPARRPGTRVLVTMTASTTPLEAAR
ncbi:histidine kinase [Rothia sp. AR01]|uniref:Histidine kinase n=1 Tax=Rothia santali TaxID=2949643 RepID=A0A9X2KH47_9MICC|nr:histidine kinase [Rothia santali]MCP3424838.1 histidine kinase [Rothia santali]